MKPKYDLQHHLIMFFISKLKLKVSETVDFHEVKIS